MRALTAALAEALPGDALVLGSYPVDAAIRTFGPLNLDVWVGGLRVDRLRDPVHQERLRQRVAGAERAYYVSAAADPAADLGRELLLRSFDLEPAAPERADGDVRIERIAPWSARRSSASLALPGAGRFRVSVYPGLLSGHPRREARLLLGETLLTDRLGDGPQDLFVNVPGSPVPDTLRLVSDAPVGARLAAEAVPVDAPYFLELGPGARPQDLARLSASLLEPPSLPYPALAPTGSVDLPTPGARGAGFVFVTGLDEKAAPPAQLRVSVGDAVLHTAKLRGREAAYEVSFAAPGEWLREGTTRLHWQLSGAGASERPLSLRYLAVYRRERALPVELPLGGERDPELAVAGFHAPAADDAPPGLSARWLHADALLRFFSPLPRQPLLLEVSTLVGARPAGEPPPAPSFALNGAALHGEAVSEPLTLPGDTRVWRRVTHRFAVPAGRLAPHTNLLRIQAQAWVHPDGRQLGLLLEGLRLLASDASQGP